MEYPLYRPVIAEAQHHSSLWRLLLGCVTVIAICIVWMVSILAIVVWFTSGDFDLIEGRAMGPADTPGSVLVFLLLIVGLGVGAWGAARFWQKRDLRSLVGRGPRALRHFVQAAAITFAMAALVFVLTRPFAQPIEPNMEFGVWVLWLPAALVCIALQTGAEELLFRGYLQSQLAARFRNAAIWLFVPSLLFGIAHLAPGLPVNAALGYVIFAALFGLMAADLTARTGTIGAAWGFHFANNSIAIVFIVAQGSLSGLGLFRSGDLVDALALTPLVLFELVALAMVWLLIRRVVTV